MNAVTVSEAAALLGAAHRVLALSHRRPDGDTAGSASALVLALRGMGKEAALCCDDPFPGAYASLYPAELPLSGEPDLIVSVDTATAELLGEGLQKYADRVGLCIDHHPTNSGYAAATCLAPQAAAAAELMLELLTQLGAPLTPAIADCLYLGLVTDTGGFRFSNTSRSTFLAAARLLELGARAADISELIFESKRFAQQRLEALACLGTRFFCGGCCAVLVVSRALLEETGALDEELEQIPSLPRQLAGVDVAITVKEKPDCCRVSVRTSERCSASALAALFGGGGHERAAGCTLYTDPETAVARLTAAAEALLAKGAAAL